MKKMITAALLSVTLTVAAVVPAFAITANAVGMTIIESDESRLEDQMIAEAEASAAALWAAQQAAQNQAQAQAQAIADAQAQALAAQQAAQAQAQAIANAQAQALAAQQAALAQTATAAASQYITMPDGVIFDAAYYAAANPDVALAYGTDIQALYKHYQQYGKKEGRSPFNPALLAQLAQ